MKKAFLKFARRGGPFTLCRFLNRQKLLILMYHRFGDGVNSFSIAPRIFEEQLQFLKAHYNVFPLQSIVESLSCGRRLPANTVSISIDDGYRDAYQIALPLLRKYNLPATIFVVTDFIDRKKWLWTDKLRFTTISTEVRSRLVRIGGNDLTVQLRGRTSRLEAADRINDLLKQLPDDEKEESIRCIASSFGVTIPDSPPAEYEALNWNELKEMAASQVEVGSHTVSHPILTRVGLERVRHELRASKETLESTLSCEVGLFCYPNGVTNSNITNEVVLAGYACAVSTVPGLNLQTEDLMNLRRVAGESDMDHFAQSTCGFEEIKKNLRKHTRVQ